MALPKKYYNLFDIARKESIKSNTVKAAIGSSGLEGIKDITALRPIAHLFKAFDNGMRKQYGILISQYEFWKRTGEPPKVSPGRPPKWKENPNFVNINIPFPKDLYEQFKQVVDKANSMSMVKVTYRDMIYVAVKEFCDRRPNLK